jgi:hypothetical protein
MRPLGGSENAESMPSGFRTIEPLPKHSWPEYKRRRTTDIQQGGN